MSSVPNCEISSLHVLRAHSLLYICASEEAPPPIKWSLKVVEWSNHCMLILLSFLHMREACPLYNTAHAASSMAGTSRLDQQILK